MAQLDPMRRYVKSSSGAGEHTMEQLFHGEDQSWAPNTSPTFWKNHDHEEHIETPVKKSVLMKVKEKARKLRHTLSKKKHSQDENATPAWGVSLDDDDEEDAEYYGAPMYESAQAPEDVKETAKQHPREDIVIADKHVVPNSNSPSKKQEDKTSKEVTESVKETTEPTEKMYTIKKVSDSSEDALDVPATLTTIEKLALSKSMSSSKTTSESATSEATKQTPESNTEDPTPAPQETKQASKTITASVAERLAPAYAMASGATGLITSKLHDIAIATTTVLSPKQSPKEVPKDEISLNQEKKYDKGVSVTEYLKHKLEPGEDEKALSQVISEAISPKKGSSSSNNSITTTKVEGSTGVVEKVRGAVSSLLANEAASKSQSQSQSESESMPRNASSNNIPISTNAYEGNQP